MAVFRVYITLLALCLAWRWAQDSPLQIEWDAFLVTTITTKSSDSAERFSLAQEVFLGNVLEHRLNLTHAGKDTLPAGASVLEPMPDSTQYLQDNARQNGFAALMLSIDSGGILAKAERHTYGRESSS